MHNFRIYSKMPELNEEVKCNNLTLSDKIFIIEEPDTKACQSTVTKKFAILQSLVSLKNAMWAMVYTNL